MLRPEKSVLYGSCCSVGAAVHRFTARSDHRINMRA